MRTNLQRTLTLVTAGVLVAACSEQPAGPAESFEAAAAPTKGCELVMPISKAAQSYFSNPERRTAQDLIKILGDACGTGIQGTTRTAAWNVISFVEATRNAGKGGALADGSTLVNGLLACTTSLCAPAALPGIDFTSALMSTGVFGVRAGGQQYVASILPIPFTDYQGNPNSAYWGIEVDKPWYDVTGSTPDPTLVYGAPIFQGGVSLKDVSLSNVQFAFHLYPDNVKDFEDDLHVGVCLTSPLAVPHQIPGDNSSPELLPAVQRAPNAGMVGVVLQRDQVSFCGDLIKDVVYASLFAPVSSLVEAILPASMRTMFFGDRSTTVIGGTPLDFSDFAVIGANTTGRLVLLNGPNPVVTEGQSVGNLVVQAVTGMDTPVEKVLVHWEVFNNSGVPAGAILTGETSKITAEVDGGLFGVARFNDVRVGKPGGYIICAYGELAGFEFAPVCSQQFQARNN